MALLKFGVNPFLGDIILRALPKIDAVHRRVIGREAIITSANDGQHMKGSLHYQDRAIDLRTYDIKPMTKVNELVSELKKALGQDWDIIDEKTHIHAEYDPKG